jgi:hypothetical protein
MRNHALIVLLIVGSYPQVAWSSPSSAPTSDPRPKPSGTDDAKAKEQLVGTFTCIKYEPACINAVVWGEMCIGVDQKHTLLRGGYGIPPFEPARAKTQGAIKVQLASPPQLHSGLLVAAPWKGQPRDLPVLQIGTERVLTYREFPPVDKTITWNACGGSLPSTVTINAEEVIKR